MNGTCNRAILQSEGTQDYRGCKIAFFTYTMGMPGAVDKQRAFKVNVNVHMQIFMNDCVKTLTLDESFKDENDAIEYAINELSLIHI